MAYQARRRDPIFAADTQAVIERRGRELVGLALVVAGVLVLALILSYSPDDPGWLAATGGEVHNWLGRIGAAIASPLAVIVGLGAWGLALSFLTWGVRFLRHKGAERALSRALFVPIAIAVCSVYASTLVPVSGWTHSFGMGGLFGDTVSGAVLGIAPFSTGLSLKILSLLSGVGTVVIGLFALGFTTGEVKRGGRFLLVGVVMAYDLTLKMLGKGARGAAIGAVGAARGARNARLRRAENRAELEAQAKDAHAYEPMIDSDEEFAAPPPLNTAKILRADLPPDEDFTHSQALQQGPKSGLFARMPGLKKRDPASLPEPELVEPEVFTDELPMPLDGLTGEDRISAKISNALKNRARVAVMPSLEPRIEPPVARRAGPSPMVLEADERVNMPDPAQPIQAEQPLIEPDYAGDDVEAETEMRAVPVPMPDAKKVVQHKTRKPARPSARAKAEAQPSLQFEDNQSEYELPPLSLLTNPISIERHHLSDEALEENARMLENVLDDYGVKGEIVSVRPGPVVTMYELEPAPGLKASRVIGLADDIARSMSALSARVSTVPGRSVIGIELPNEAREKVVLREILSTRDFGDNNMRLPLALGKDIGGDPIVANLAKMPHLLIAGTTGSGKSVAINTMILSLLYRLTPDECRLIMIDPKMLELSVYDGIPHLLSPVVTDPKKAVVALKWVVGEMEERYRKMSKMNVRNIEGYNGKVRDALAKDEMFSRTVQTGFDDETGEPVFETEEFAPESLPYIVVVVDEMADLMMVAGKEIEACIQRLAQMARASGIHLIMATQRPSVDVITGTIKANFPTRISFQVTSKIDSRTILGEQGAEQLLGMGDMLYMAGGARITRVHGPFVSDEEVEEIVNYLKSFGAPEYVGGVVDGPAEGQSSDIDAVLGLGGNTNGEDALYDQAVGIVIQDRKCSTSYIQRKLSIGYNKAAKLVEQMEDQGLVSASNHVGKREILIPEQQQDVRG
ncbi:MAG: DNA translocase FtsK [Rhodobacteraceae bacterium]|nr:DNA translocase FtsK [Paracoccaceae bacterium]